MNIINITADTRKKSTMLVPNVVQNDSLNVFVVKIQEDRQDIELEDGIAYTLTNEDGIIIKGDKTGPNEITFNVPGSVLKETGAFSASIQLYHEDGRISTLEFVYNVVRDLTGEFIPSDPEKTLIEIVLVEGPKVIQDAKDATVDANDAADKANHSAENEDQTMAEVEQVKNDTAEVRDTTESVRAATDLVRQETEIVRDATESERIATAKVRDETVEVKNDTDQVRRDTVIAKDEATQATTNADDATVRANDGANRANTASGLIEPLLVDEQVRVSDADVQAQLATLNATQSQIIEAMQTNNENMLAMQERLDGTFDTRVTGSNVEYPFVDNVYEGGVIKTRTMGLSWEAFNIFGTGNVSVPADSYIDREADALMVNGFSTLGVVIRDIKASGRGKIRLQVYWQGTSGRLNTPTAVSEEFAYNPTDNTGTGLALSIPTKSEYVSFRFYNEESEEKVFYAVGLLRA